MEIEDFTMPYYDEVLSLWKRVGLSIGFSDEKAEVQRMLERNRGLLLIGKVNNKVIGVVEGGYDGRRGYVHHLAIDPEFQKRGYGTRIMLELMERFRQYKVYKVHLFVEKHQKSVVSFYKKLGWEKRTDLIMMSFFP
jgi:ribosomal protein S18 acetylase RimI-like enzyme